MHGRDTPEERFPPEAPLRAEARLGPEEVDAVVPNAARWGGASGPADETRWTSTARSGGAGARCFRLHGRLWGTPRRCWEAARALRVSPSECAARGRGRASGSRSPRHPSRPLRSPLVAGAPGPRGRRGADPGRTARGGSPASASPRGHARGHPCLSEPATPAPRLRFSGWPL